MKRSLEKRGPEGLTNEAYSLSFYSNLYDYSSNKIINTKNEYLIIGSQNLIDQ